MAEAKIEKLDDGAVKVSGALSFTGVVPALEISKVFFSGSGPLVFDLAAVEKIDSAGLALLIEWMCMAEKSGQNISFKNPSKQLLDIAMVSGLDEVLPVA